MEGDNPDIFSPLRDYRDQLRSPVDSEGNQRKQALYSKKDNRIESRDKSDASRELLDALMGYFILLGPKDLPWSDKNLQGFSKDMAQSFLGEIFLLLPQGNTISGFTLEKGLLNIRSRKIPEMRDRTYILNLADIILFQNGDLNIDRNKLQLAFKTPIQKSLDTLKDEVEIESYFGGAMIVSYERIEGAKNVAGASAVAGIAGAGLVVGGSSIFDLGRKGFREAQYQYRIKKVAYRDQGVTKTIDPSILSQFSNVVGSKLKLAELNMQIMQKAGLVFNVVRKSFTTLQLAALDKAASAIARMKYVPAYGTPADFELAKADIRAKMGALEPHKIGEFLSKIQSGLVSSTKAGAKALSKGGSAAFLGVDKILWNQFFLEYQKNYQDSLSIYKDLAGLRMFYAGMDAFTVVADVGAGVAAKGFKQGFNLGAKAPGLYRVPASIIGGIAGILLTESFLHSDYMNRSLWKAAPNRYAGDGKKSQIVHGATLGVTNDLVDVVGVNFGIPGTRGGARIANPFGKDIILPELMFNKTDVSFATNPREYLNGRQSSVGLWNQRMDDFTGTESTPGYAAPAVMEILTQYKKGIGVFRPSNLAEYDDVPVNERAKTVLRERLEKIIAGGNIADEANVKTVTIVDDVVSYITDTIAPMKNPSEQEAQLRMVLRNYGNILKITPESIAHDKQLLEKDELYIRNLTGTFVGMYSGVYRDFLGKVFDRIYSGKEVVTNKGEQKLFDALIDSKQKLFVEQGNAMGLPPENLEGKTQGDYFCFLLGYVAKYHTEAQYLHNIEKTGYANEWEGLYI